MNDSTSTGPLAGVRVVEIAQAIAGPVCGQILASMGADVIKIEPPGGDLFRHVGRRHPSGERVEFALFNRNKRSLSLDLTDLQSLEVLHPLIRSADIAIVAVKGSDLARFGISYEDLAAENPRLVYLQSTAFGSDGPMRDEGGFDVVVQGVSGIGAVTGAPGPYPRHVRPPYADFGTSFLGALAAVTALRHRDLTGEGQRVEVSLLATAISFLGGNGFYFDDVDAQSVSAAQEEMEEIASAGGDFGDLQAAYYRRFVFDERWNVYFRHYRTADGFISVGCASSRQAERLRHALEFDDPRVDATTTATADELAAMVRTAEAAMVSKSTRHWLDRLRRERVPCGPFNFPTDLADDEQVKANGLVLRLEHPTLGGHLAPAPPIKMDRTPLHAAAPSPGLGADTDAIIEELGLDATTIARLRTDGVISAGSV